MRKIGLAAMTLAVVSAGAARADPVGPVDWLRRAAAAVHSLFGKPAGNYDIIAPPGDIDQPMVLAPPPLGTMRVMAPPEQLRQR